MVGRRRLLSNTAWNVAGQLAPLVVGVLTLPLLIRLVGLERFGFITLVWVLVGYASIFDFGIGRALVRTVAAHLAHADRPRSYSGSPRQSGSAGPDGRAGCNHHRTRRRVRCRPDPQSLRASSHRPGAGTGRTRQPDESGLRGSHHCAPACAALPW